MAARQYYSAAQSSEIQHDGVTWLDVCTLTFTPDANSDYILFWSARASLVNNRSSDVNLRVLTDGVASVETNLENRDESGYALLGGFYRIRAGVSPSTTTVKLQIQPEASGITAKARNANLTALKLGPDDIYVEDLTTKSVTGSNIRVDMVSATFTPPTLGDYLCLYSSIVQQTAVSVSCYMGLRHESLYTSNDWGNSGSDITNWAPSMMLWKRTLPASPQTIASWMRSHHTTNTCYSKDNRLLLLRVDDFDAAYYAEQTETSMGSVESTYVNALSLTATVTTNPHLILGGWSQSADINGNIVLGSRILDGGEERVASNRVSLRGVTRPLELGQYFAVADGYTAGSRTWTLQKYGDGVNPTTLYQNSAFAVLDLGSEIPPTPTRKMARYSFAL